MEQSFEYAHEELNLVQIKNMPGQNNLILTLDTCETISLTLGVHMY